MPNSPGSMVNQYRLDEDDVERPLAVRDLFITVDKPESHVTAIETFITYRVVTKVGPSSVASVPFCRTSVGAFDDGAARPPDPIGCTASVVAWGQV